MTDIQFKEIPLTGKWRKGMDPLLFDDADFTDIQNIRPYDRGWRSVNGMSKINTTALTTYLKTRSGFHFNKESPAESHVLIQAENSGETASQVLQNTTAIPSAGDFSGTALMTDTSGAGKGRFSDAPQGQVCYCNSKDPPQIWAGDEQKCAAFISSTAAITNTITNPRVYTPEVQNTLEDADQVAIIGGGDDSFAKLLLHCDGADGGTTFTDDGETGHVVTANGTAVTDIDQKKFGSASGYFDGNSDYLSIPDHADWNFGSGELTIDFWIRFNTLPVAPTKMGIFQQYVDASNYYTFYVKQSASFYELMFEGENGGVQDISVGSNPVTLTTNTWYHVALVRGYGGNANDWGIALDGVFATYATDSVTLQDLAAAFEIGRETPWDTSYFDGWLDEIRVSKGVTRWTANFTSPARAYHTATREFIVGCTRPAQGVKLYIPTGSGNTESGTLTGKEWNGASWTAITITDNTSGLASTGTVTWTSTVDSSKPKLLNGLLLYWYQFSLDTGNADIYYCTVDMPWQRVTNIWDGVYRSPFAFKKYDGTNYYEYVLDVNVDANVQYADGPVAQLDALTATTSWVVVGFTERMRGLHIRMYKKEVNTTAATTLAINYWDGAAWVAASSLVDGTEANSISLAQTGTVMWEPPGISEEFPREVDSSAMFYYYQLVWDENLDASVDVDRVWGIPEPAVVRPHKFSFAHQGRLMLASEVDGTKNTLLPSAYLSPDVYNGDDGGIKIYFGDDKELTAGASFYTRFGADMYYQAVITKKNTTYLLDGWEYTGDHQFNVFEISGVIGCPAPLTMAVCDIGHALAPAQLKQVVIWMSDIGPVAFDGSTIQPIGEEIGDYWNSVKSDYINTSQLPNFVGWYDSEYQEYHLCIATGANTTLDTELVFDLQRKRWFKINRGSAQAVQCGFVVKDTDGKAYTYGAIDTGYMMRLENTNAFVSTAITSYFEMGDIVLGGSIFNKYLLHFFKLITASKTSTPDDTISVTVYTDTETSGTSLTAVTNEESGQRVVFDIQSGQMIDGCTHRVKCSVNTTDVAEGFEPLVIGYAFKTIRDASMTI